MIRLLPALLLSLPLWACGGGKPPAADAGLPSGYALEILNPPGDSVGLPFSGVSTLRVRYVDAAGTPVPNAEVRFSLVASGQSEATGGATLSDDVAITDELGIARVDLTAGAAEVNFRVQVTAPFAPPALFFIAVSADGFVELQVVPRHEGWRDLTAFESIELRLYMAADLRCSELDIDDPPDSVLPPRSLSFFGDTATFPNLAGQRGYTLIAWSVGQSSTPLAHACADLTEDQMQTGPPVQLDLTLRDRPLAFEGAVALTSSFDLAPLRAALEAELVADPWNHLDCPLGPAQLLLDCALDGHSPDGLLDCEVTGEDSDGLIAAVEAERGAPDASGCRPAAAPGGGDSLDQTLLSALDGTFPLPGAGLDALTGARKDALAAVELRSELSAALGVARHRLLAADLSIGGETETVEIFSSARPVVEQAQVPATVAADTLELGAHGFTLRYGSIAHAAFVAGGLAPAGLAGRDGELGTALTESAADCAGLSSTICAAVGRASDCLEGCAGMATALDDRLELWWQLLDGDGIDLELEGSGVLVDEDADLAVDGLGSPQTPGTWSATVTPASNEPVELTGDLFTP